MSCLFSKMTHKLKTKCREAVGNGTGNRVSLHWLLAVFSLDLDQV